MLGLRERADVGVEGTLEDEKERAWCRSCGCCRSSFGKFSLNLEGSSSGELLADEERGVLVVVVGKLAFATWWSGEAGRRLPSRKLLLLLLSEKCGLPTVLELGDGER